MKFSLIVCTYMRPEVLLNLLNSVAKQTLYPNEILIIDGSLDDKTKNILSNHDFENSSYFKVNKENRGLTRQRNFGISKVSDTIDIVCFLDDDIVLTDDYFKNLIKTYKKEPSAMGVGGYITNEVNWRCLKGGESISFKEFSFDGYVRNIGLRNVIRKIVGLLSDKRPCFMPEFSNGFSVGYLPPSGNIYKAEYFMGGVSSFKKEVVDAIKFSIYFEGYGLYEDLDYCIRVSKKHKLFVNTAAELSHFHDSDGRPNKYSFGKMVTRNGWYVWRQKYPNPSIKGRIKWNSIVWLLLLLKLMNTITTSKKKESLSESAGRFIGWWSLIFNKPKITR